MAKHKEHPDSRMFDAYFIDEFGVVNDASNTPEPARFGLHKNIFTDFITVSGTVAESAKSGSATIPNMADPANNPLLKARPGLVHNPVEIHGLSDKYSYYFSESVITYAEKIKADNSPWEADKPIKLTLLFAVGTEMNRSGLRTFFKDNTDMAGIILVPGIEPGSEGSNKGRWGISLTDNDIKALLLNFFFIPAHYEVVILAAYSTGMNGVNQTVLNEILRLDKIKRIIIYDCLYLQSSGKTSDMFKKMKNINSNVEIIIYWSSVSSDANSLNASKSQLLVLNDAKPVITSTGNVIKLAGERMYRALVCTRIIQVAEQEGFFVLSSDRLAAYKAITAILPDRGKVISDENMYKKIYGSLPSGHISLNDWYLLNQKVVDEFYKYLDKRPKGSNSLMEYIVKYKIMGWLGAGAETHDLLLPEFGWEYLAYRK